MVSVGGDDPGRLGCRAVADRLRRGVMALIGPALAGVFTGCAPAPPYAALPDPGAAERATPVVESGKGAADSTQPPSGRLAAPAVDVDVGTGSGACGRLLALRDYSASIQRLIDAMEADGVTDAERTDLMQAYSRLHAARAAEASASADVAAARYRLEALTGGTLKAGDLPACE